jgi:hypothetical protein
LASESHPLSSFLCQGRLHLVELAELVVEAEAAEIQGRRHHHLHHPVAGDR